LPRLAISWAAQAKVWQHRPMPTLSEMAAKDQRIGLTCRCSPRVVDLWPTKLMERWGDVELETLQGKFRCTMCNKTDSVTVKVSNPWRPEIGQMKYAMGTVSAEYRAEMAARESGRRKGRKNRLPEKHRDAIINGAKNLGKPEDV
jgi:hypothetical protein